MNPPERKRAKLLLELDVNNVRASILQYAMKEFLTEPEFLYEAHMQDEEERIAMEEYAQVLALEEEETLYLAMSGMSLSSSIPCPICFTGELRQSGNNSVACTHCQAKAPAMSMRDLSARLDLVFQQHAMQCPSPSRISTQQSGGGEWVLHCSKCAMHVNVF